MGWTTEKWDMNWNRKEGRGREAGTRDNMVLELLFARDKIKEFALLRKLSTEKKAQRRKPPRTRRQTEVNGISSGNIIPLPPQ